MMEVERIEADINLKEKMNRLQSCYDLSHDDLTRLLDIEARGDDRDFNDSEFVRISQETEAFLCLFKIQDDERLRCYINELQIRYNIDATLLSKILKTKEMVIEEILNHSDAVSIEDRYSIAIKAAYLLLLLSARN
ncbi:MAG: hypothetical protein Q4C65_12270 [Eubacteriales bacterium]|nr:hypothetical protein [Eubacteriales bacterium]